MAQRVEEGDGWTLHLGDWRDDVLPEVDATIEDPPYGKRTHAGQRHERKAGGGHALLSHTGFNYVHLTPADVDEVVSRAHATGYGWGLWMTSHDLIPAYEAACDAVRRYHFAPIPIVIPSMNVRLAGDGPNNWTVHMLVTRTKRKHCWGTKPGYYQCGVLDLAVRQKIAGTKPLALMEAILRDYTARGDLVMDRFAGSGTTGVAAIRLGRRFVGWERKPEHFEIALKRLRAARPQAEAFATDGIIGKPMQLPGTEDTDATE